MIFIIIYTYIYINITLTRRGKFKINHIDIRSYINIIRLLLRAVRVTLLGTIRYPGATCVTSTSPPFPLTNIFILIFIQTETQN